MHIRTSLYFLLAFLLLASPAWSQSIAVANYGFASPFTSYAAPGATGWVQSPQPSWWTGTAQDWADSFGVFKNVPYQWIDNLVPSGGTSVHQQAAFMFDDPGMTASQLLTNTYQIGQSYQLTVGIAGGGYGMLSWNSDGVRALLFEWQRKSGHGGHDHANQ